MARSESSRPVPIDPSRARDWLDRWDRQQELYLPHREARFQAMFDVLEAMLPPEFRALDVGAGPGSLSARLLARFPNARSTAVDFDPVLLALGRAAHRDLEGRLAWIEADLRTPSWAAGLPSGDYDAVLSTTALHWFDERTLARIYGDLASRLRTGGLLLNGDEIIARSDPPLVRTLLDSVHERFRRTRDAPGPKEDWETWWSRISQEPGLADEVTERRRRYPQAHTDGPQVSLEGHAEFLRAAGFRAVGIVWQEFDNRVLVAVR